ncbi:MAG TPA: hypothetical protein VD994_11685 [Prosthecobacter sp.]|nr:hypothetical protein [Prosthecobacter sp.]
MRSNFSWQLCLLAFCLSGSANGGTGGVPAEPVEIGTQPQFLIDDYIVDNRWSLKPKREEVIRAFHAPKKAAENPIIPDGAGYVTAARDADTGLIRLWYQTNHATMKGGEEGNAYAVAYAESRDGVHWSRPNLGLYEWLGSKENNIVWPGPRGARASGPQILQLSENDMRGYRYLLAYRTGGAKKGENGVRLIGSADGIHWDEKGDTLLLELHSDTLNSIVYDPVRGEYVMYCRPKDRYLIGQEGFLDSGESRRVARIGSRELWTVWKGSPSTILIPDEADVGKGFNRFYGMPCRWNVGIYWGCLWPFRLNTDIVTELAWSRDGIDFERLPLRPRLIELGAEGAWDDGMVFGSPDWVEVGDEWWFFYAGSDGPHESRERTTGIGVAKIRKEGLVSMRGPPGGGVVCTRQLQWPGGVLLINADAQQGEIQVRVSGDRRAPLSGYDYRDCDRFTGDRVAHEVTWKGQSLNALKGQVIRLEFMLKNADLYTFRAKAP